MLARGTVSVDVQAERVNCTPWGLEGGLPGTGNNVELVRDGKPVRDLPNAKVLAVHLKAGDLYVVRSGGGGGFGPPAERPHAQVLDSVGGSLSLLGSAQPFLLQGTQQVIHQVGLPLPQ